MRDSEEPNVNMLELTNIHYSVHKKCIFKGATTSLKNGECVAITGDNGSGKSTLLKIIAGLMVPNKGNVKIDSRKILAMSRNRRLSHCVLHQ
ncbi:ATP-binding cassette domain-containing protein [Virgibacillus dakarensis]|uniref:ABC transporter domain-containing protein n=1 Tax=Lentibacillus populi TaxID=1827502 RepID=A0A9W5TZD3_9BACI|nr:ATP-binding cassette domain-containing protein [Virgibacillus dakarensis]GGB52309.1 hypothetical protein GCM10011409_32330 [Lentibacillus populi]